MIDGSKPAGAGGLGGFVRWGSAFLLILLVHGALGAALLFHPAPPLDGLPSDAVLIDLPAEPSLDPENPDDAAGPEIASMAESDLQPDVVPEPEPPAPDQPPPELAQAEPVAEPPPEPPPPDQPPPELAQAEPEAPPEATIPPASIPDSGVVLPPPPEEPARPERKAETRPKAKAIPKPDRRLTPDQRARQERRTAPSQARAAPPPIVGGGRPSAAAVATWSAQLGAHLARHKRFPADARARGQQGTATLRIVLDGGGRVVSRALARSSGSPSLDGESLAMIVRAHRCPDLPRTWPCRRRSPFRFDSRSVENPQRCGMSAFNGAPGV